MVNKDFLGRELKIGDLVSFTQSKNVNINIGVVDGFCPKSIRINRIKNGKLQSYPDYKESKLVCKLDIEGIVYE